MVREVVLADLLRELDYEVEEVSEVYDRCVHKHELERYCEIMGIEYENTSLFGIRTAIREQVLRRPDKCGTSRFSQNEIYRMYRNLKNNKTPVDFDHE